MSFPRESACTLKPDTVGTEARMGKVISSSQAGRGGARHRPASPTPRLSHKHIKLTGEAGGVRNHPRPPFRPCKGRERA